LARGDGGGAKSALSGTLHQDGARFERYRLLESHGDVAARLGVDLQRRFDRRVSALRIEFVIGRAATTADTNVGDRCTGRQRDHEIADVAAGLREAVRDAVVVFVWERVHDDTVHAAVGRARDWSWLDWQRRNARAGGRASHAISARAAQLAAAAVIQAVIAALASIVRACLGRAWCDAKASG